MRLAYIVGPFRGSSHWEVFENIHAARRVSLAAARAGFMPVCPHANTSEFDGVEGISGKFWLEGTLEMMRRCDVVVLSAGWEKSEGSQAEVKEACRMGLPVGHVFARCGKEAPLICMDGLTRLPSFKNIQGSGVEFLFVELSVRHEQPSKP